MFPAPFLHMRTVRTRVAIYVGCVSSIFFAALLFSFHNGLPTPKRAPANGGKPASSQVRPRLIANYAKLPLSFEANQGQVDARVNFLSRGRGLTLFLTGSEAVLEVEKTSVVRRPLSVAGTGTFDARRARNSTTLSRGATTDHGPRTTDVIRLRLDSANQNAVVTGVQELPGKVNYFIGNDPKKWRTNLPTYAKVRYHNVYPGVDLEYYGNQVGQLEYDFIVAPGADPCAIALDVRAVREPPLRIDGNGDLVIPAEGSEVRFHKPVIYQPGSADERRTMDNGPRTAANPKPKIENPKSVEGRFRLNAQNRIRFALGPYDHSKPLVIDPELVYSTYLGGTSSTGQIDSANGVAVDSSGNAYVVGTTYSNDIPTVNPFQASSKSIFGTAFVTKFNSTGSALVYSTYLGGSGGDKGIAIAVDSAGSAYVTGQTCSSDFPTALPLQAALKGGCDPFVTKFSSAGSSLVYSTYLGGSSGSDASAGIAVDSSGNAYLTGGAVSADFPTVNPLQPSLNGTENAFVAKLNAAGSALVYSTYLGGSGEDQGAGIAVDSSGSAYVTGSTQSSDFPTANALQSSLNGVENAFISKLNAAGSALVYSTYLGGDVLDEGEGIAVDSSGNAYLTGYTSSPNFPTVNPIQTYPGEYGSGAAFVSKLNSAGSALTYSTYLGGSIGQNCYIGGDGLGIAVDSLGVAYVAGRTCSPNFPTVNAIQATDMYVAPEVQLFTGFVACLNAAGSGLAYSTYLGGTSQGQVNAIGVDSSGDAFVVGSVGAGFPTVNPIQANSTGGAIVAMISPPPAVALFPASLNFGNVLGGTTSPQMSVTLAPLTNASSVSVSSIAASGDFALVTTATSCPYSGGTLAAAATCTVDITFTPTATGARSGTVTVTYTGNGSPETISLSGAGIVSAAKLSPVNLNLGNVDVGATSNPQVVILTNPNSVALTVSSVTITGGFTETDNCTPAVAANSNCTINVIFAPGYAQYPGTETLTGTLTVTDYAGNSPQTSNLSGTVVLPPASLSPTSLTFGDTPVGSWSAPQTITLISPSNGGTGVPEISVTSPSNGMPGSGDWFQQNVCDSMSDLVTDEPCPITITFTPIAIGTRTGTLTVTYTSPAPLTLTASLTGTGTGAAVGLSATSLSFAAQTVSSQSAPQTITLTNTGNVALTPLKITRTGDFAESNTCGSSVAGGASCTISVTFSPEDAGSRSGTLTLTDNASNSPQTVALSGTGMDFTVSSSTSSQTVSPGQTANYSLTLAPYGGFSQSVNLTCAGAPSESTCTLTPNTVTLNGTASGTVAVAVATTASSSMSPPHVRFLLPGVTGLRGVFWVYALLWLASVLVLAGVRRRRAAWLLGAGLLIVMWWCACGGGGSHQTTPPNPGTPAGTYTIDVTGTDATISTLTHTIQLTMTVN